MLEKYDLYIEELLLAQYRVSEMIEHKLERGEMREDFIKNQVSLQYNKICCCKGVMTDRNGEHQSGQIDFIIPKQNARERKLGDHSLFSVDDLTFVIEVKSNATGSDFSELNRKAETYKAMDGAEFLMVGMFCYYYDLQMKTILKRFGWIYDNEIQSFQFSSSEVCTYPQIDFVVALDDNEEMNQKRCFFLIKDNSYSDTAYVLYQDYPVSKHFFKLMSKNLV